MNQKKKYLPAEIVLVAILLVGVIGTSVCIWNIVKARSFVKELHPVVLAPQEEVEVSTRQANRTRQRVFNVQDDRPQFTEPPMQAPIQEAPMMPAPTAPVAAAPPMQSFQGNQQMMGTGPGGEMWQQAFGDLQMSDEEQGRFQQGMQLATQRFFSMSEGERQQEMQRMMDMGQRWAAMSETDRQAATSRMRQRFEDWRKSGGIELPQPSLD